MSRSKRSPSPPPVEELPLIDPDLAAEVVGALGALVDYVGGDSAAAIVLRQARTEIVSLATSQPQASAVEKRAA